MNYHTSSISSRSTQTSSVFSNENEDYDARIREIEEYYIKTLLSEDADEDPVTKHQQQQQYQYQLQAQPLPGFYSRSAFAGSQQSQQWFQRPLFEFHDPWPQKMQQKEPSLEVEINSQYRPANGIMPLTSENLRLIDDVPAQPSAAQQQAAENVHQSSCAHSHEPVAEQQPEKVNKQLYKTELCESFATKGSCKYGNKCQFAHGLQELKLKERSTNFRTKPCVNWGKYGYCRYGKRCCFKHGDDHDIKVYVQAGTIKKPEEDAMRKNMHADVRALQRMTW